MYQSYVVDWKQLSYSVFFRIDFKIALTVLKIISTGQPTLSIQNLINNFVCTCSWDKLRSSATNNLVVPLAKSKLHTVVMLSKFIPPPYGSSLPAAIKNSVDTSMSLLDTFKRTLKAIFINLFHCEGITLSVYSIHFTTEKKTESRAPLAGNEVARPCHSHSRAKANS